jgi:hypothetical protein
VDWSVDEKDEGISEQVYEDFFPRNTQAIEIPEWLP